MPVCERMTDETVWFCIIEIIRRLLQNL